MLRRVCNTDTVLHVRQKPLDDFTNQLSLQDLKRTHAHIHAHIRADTPTYAHMYICTHTHTHTDTYKHTLTHAGAHTQALPHTCTQLKWHAFFGPTTVTYMHGIRHCKLFYVKKTLNCFMFKKSSVYCHWSSEVETRGTV